MLAISALSIVEMTLFRLYEVWKMLEQILLKILTLSNSAEIAYI